MEKTIISLILLLSVNVYASTKTSNLDRLCLKKYDYYYEVNSNTKVHSEKKEVAPSLRKVPPQKWSNEWYETTAKQRGSSYYNWAQEYRNTVQKPMQEPCFEVGTRVLTPSGPREIEALNVGDQVMAFDHNTNQVVVSKVTKTHHKSYEVICTLETFSPEEGINFSVGVTSNHPFYIMKQRRYLPIGNIVSRSKNADIKLTKVTHSGDFLTNIQVESFKFKEVGDVYNIQVEKYHNYFLEDGTLVHNK